MDAAVPVLHRRPGLVRLVHTVTAVAVGFLMLTGANIFNAHPALYWGAAGSDVEAGQRWLAVETVATPAGLAGRVEVLGRRFGSTGLFGASVGKDGTMQAVAYPHWATFPSWRNLATARTWHFFWAWVLIAAGLAYLGHGTITGRIGRELLPRRRDLAPAALWRDVRAHLRLRFDPPGHGYNVLQRLAYAGVALGLLPLLVVTGLAMAPGIDATLGLAAAFGGRQSARSLHWLAANGVLLFLAVHLLLVLLSGPWRQLRGITLGDAR